LKSLGYLYRPPNPYEMDDNNNLGDKGRER
jgi:hypothetical protein